MYNYIERARSLSPTKDSPSDFSTPDTFIDTSTDFGTIRFSTSPSHPHQLAMPSSSSKADNAGEMAQNTGDEVTGDTSSSQDTVQLSKSGLSLITHQSSLAPPSRSSTLAWQQRPTAKSRHNFLTGSSALESSTSTPDLGSTQEGEPSLSQIAQSLGSKDPKWFRQTADRGLGSAAYKQSEDHNAIDRFSSSESKRLPGMSRESTIEPEKESSSHTVIIRPESPSRGRSLHENTARSQRFSASTTTPSSPFSSPIPTLNSQRFEPPVPERAPSQESESAYPRGIAMSPSQGRLLRDRIDRPPSPTKGLGGFVQSAMLKRSESVNKRWSAQAGTGLSRGNSIASNRSGYDGPKAAFNSMTSPREGKIASQKTSPISLSRPGSSHSTSTIPKSILIDEAQARTEEASANATGSQDSDGFIKPALPNISRLSSKDIDDKISGTSEVENSPPTTPSKSVDTKKWAPAKSSWLDNAINKPDPPKPKAMQLNQPSWMVNISKARQQRGSVDMEKSAVFTEVPTGGLLRSPPMGCNTNPTSLNGSNSISSARVTSKDEVNSSPDLLEKKSRSVSEKNEEATGDSERSIEPSQAGTVGEKMRQTGSDMRSKISRVPSSSTEIIKSSLAKPKPVTPPKKDFRSNLKSRQVSGDHTKQEEPEFKNVFGKLKRAQTQNYVAPDELKDNIMRGKTGLATTGGPKKTERRDELKESILKKKAEMKGRVPMNIDRKVGGSVKGIVQEGSVPEAINKNVALGKSEAMPISNSTLVMTDLKVPGLGPLKQAATEKLIPKPEKQPDAPGGMQREPAGNGKLAGRFNPTLAGLLSRGPSPVTSGTRSDHIKNSSKPHDNQSTLVEGQAGGESSGSAQLIHATKGRARGPKRRLPTSVKQETDIELKSPDRDNAVLKTITGKYENHSLVTIPKEPLLEDRSIAGPLSNIPDSSNRNFLAKPLGKPNTPTRKIVLDKVKPSSPQSPLPLDQAPTPTSATRLSLQQQPKTSPKSPKVRKPSTSIIHSPAPTTSPFQLPAKSEQHLTRSDLPLTIAAKRPLLVPPNSQSTATISHEELSSYPRSGLLLSQQSHPHPLEKSDREIMSEAFHSGSPHNANFPQSQKSKSLTKLPTREDEEAITSVAGLGERTAKEPIGLGIRSLPDSLSASTAHHLGLPTPPLRSPIETPKSSPLRPKKPQSIANRVVSNIPPSLALPQLQTESDTKTLRAQHLIIDFFGEIPTSKTRVEVNTHKVLSTRASSDDSDKIKTLRKQIWQLSGDGKKTSIASHQEHILYGDNMYLCTHVFGSGELGTRKTEVYLWHGEAVPSSAIEDAQLFARKTAKDNNGKLIIMRQGKETSNFFQALGGIVVTRRGSSSTYMLCGRRHVGQIAFDEVPFKTGSLCSGFPYIISARFGKLYLWKGKGSGHDELGCARLIGMDLGLTGEIEEVEEGNESEDFWEAFPDRKARLPPTGDVFWHLKPSCERFNTHLFIVDVEIPAPKSSSGLTFAWGRRGSTPVSGENNVATITEIYPFAQPDLKDPGVFVLDTFFEIFVYVIFILTPLSVYSYSLAFANLFANLILPQYTHFP